MSYRPFGAVLCLVSLVLSAAPSLAAPWAEPGDRVLRRDIELLAAYRVIEGPITTWPISWAQISRSLAQMPDDPLPMHVQRAIDRVKAHIPAAEDYRGFGVKARLSGTNEPRTVRGFDGGARTEADMSVAIDKHFASTYVRLEVGYRNDPFDDDNISFDGSYMAQALGNWVVFGGFVDQWWGPGNDSALLWSTNARPFPRLGITRLDPRAFDLPVLKYLGPWNLNITAGRLESGRGDFDNPIVLGMRFTFQPFRGFDLSFNRTLQICGGGRPCGFDTWKDALFPIGDADNTGMPSDPSNQLFGVDLRYSNRVGGLTYDFYGELIGEDEVNLLPGALSLTLGGSVSGHMDHADLAWTFRVEGSDTLANRLFDLGTDERPGITYNNFIYTDGFTFRNRPLGASVDGDSYLFTVEGSVIDRHDRSYWLRYRFADINDQEISRFRTYSVSANNETINIVELGAMAPTPVGQARIEVRLMDDQPNTPGRNDFNAAFEVSWTVRF